MAVISANLRELGNLEAALGRRLGDCRTAATSVTTVGRSPAVNIGDPGVRQVPPRLGSIAARLESISVGLDARKLELHRFLAEVTALDRRGGRLGAGSDTIATRLTRHVRSAAQRLRPDAVIAALAGVGSLAITQIRLARRAGLGILRRTGRIVARVGRGAASVLRTGFERYVRDPWNRLRRWIGGAWRTINDRFMARWNAAWLRFRQLLHNLRSIVVTLRHVAGELLTAGLMKLGFLGIALAPGLYDPSGTVPPSLSDTAADADQSLQASIASTRNQLTAALDRLHRLRAQRGVVDALLDGIADIDPLVDGPEESIKAEIEFLERRLQSLERLAQPGRTYLQVDARGDGRVVEVLGDLSKAKHVAIVVPGMSNDIDNYERTRQDAVNLLAAMRASSSGEEVAVIVWLGYDTPDNYVEAAGSALAKNGAAQLCDFVAQVRQQVPGPDLSVVAHSYGSRLTGEALKGGLAVDRAVVVGSPGMGVGNFAEFGWKGELWVGRSPSDHVSFAPGHGPDPTQPGFDAKHFGTGGSEGHSEYFTPGTDSVENIGRIVTDEQPL